MGVRRVPIDGDSEDKSTVRREVLTEVLRSGWPDVTTWCMDVPYGMKDMAQDIHQKFLFDLCDDVVEGALPLAGVISLGALARTNMPRAMYLLGRCSEGGRETNIPMHWAVLSNEPERKMIDE